MGKIGLARSRNDYKVQGINALHWTAYGNLNTPF
jgi:hypothetical protein